MTRRSRSGMNRRDYLRLFGVAAAAGLAGCGDQVVPPDPIRTQRPSQSPSPGEVEELTAPLTRHGITFERVLHAVDDLGMDPSGRVAIDDALDAAYADGTLVVFPPGKYLATDQHDWDTQVAGFGLLGLGDSHRDVEFVFPRGNAGAPDPANYWFLNVRNGRDHLLENVTIQQTDDHVTGVGMVFFVEDGLQIHDVEVAGFNPRWDYDPGNAIVAAITDVDGVGVIRRFRYAGGGVTGVYPQRKTPIGAFENHFGELRILEPYVEESGSHTMYVSRTNGCVRVEDGVFVNNDNTNLRMSGGGHPTKQSWTKRCRIFIDVDNAKLLPPGEAYQGARGLWVECGREPPYGHTNLLVEDLEIVARSNGKPLPLVLVEHDHGAATFRNVTLDSSVEGATVIDVRSVDASIVREPYGVTFENVRVRTEASRTTTDFAVRVDGRPRSRVEGLSVDIRRGEVGGLLVEESPDTDISETHVTTHLSAWQEAAFGDDPLLLASLGDNPGIVIERSDNFSLLDSDADVPGDRILVVESAPR